MRRLEVTASGYWYTALTIALGVVALVSANNVLYLIESLLLSGMIFSGVLSERSIAAVEIDFRRYPACAKSPSRDQIGVKNRRKFTLFCIEVGEWKDRRFVPAAYIPRVGPAGETVVSSRVEFDARGVYRWSGLAVATSYPFGLAKKIRIIEAPGERLIWPEKGSGNPFRETGAGQGSGSRQGQDFAEGEVRPYTHDDDCRNIVWTLSGKGMGPFVRIRRSDEEEPRVTLDLRQEAGPEFEKTVAAAAQPFYRQHEGSDAGLLVVTDETGSRSFHGKLSVLNQLALAQPKGRAGNKRGEAA